MGRFLRHSETQTDLWRAICLFNIQLPKAYLPPISAVRLPNATGVEIKGHIPHYLTLCKIERRVCGLSEGIFLKETKWSFWPKVACSIKLSCRGRMHIVCVYCRVAVRGASLPQGAWKHLDSDHAKMWRNIQSKRNLIASWCFCNVAWANGLQLTLISNICLYDRVWTGQDSIKMSQNGNIWPIWGEASTVPIETKICVVGKLADITMCAKL